MVNRTKQPEGCIGISEKCVFVWKSLSSRYREQLKVFRYSFLGTIPNFLNRLLDSLLLVRST